MWNSNISPRYHINLLLNNSLRLTVVIIIQNEDQTAKSASILLIIVMIDKPRAVQLVVIYYCVYSKAGSLSEEILNYIWQTLISSISS